MLLIPWACVSLAYQELNVSKCDHRRKITGTNMTKWFQPPATLRKASCVSKSKTQIQSSFRTKQPLRTQGVAAVVTCLCMILMEHNTALASHSCSGHRRGKTPDKAGYECFSACPFPFPFIGKLLLMKDHGSEVENMLPVWRQRTPCCVEAARTCMTWGIRS